MEQQDLFGNYKYCENCRRPLSLTYENNLCPGCIEQQLFHKVKEFIRENDVTEYDVALHFDIPLSRVKRWIREGRIEYKDKRLNTITLQCIDCGAPITFGSLCSKCLRKKNTSGYSAAFTADSSRMRFLDDAKKDF